MEESQQRATGPELAKVQAGAPAEAVTRKKRGPKGPNPLSVKKKKRSAGEFAKVGEKRKRD